MQQTDLTALESQVTSLGNTVNGLMSTLTTISGSVDGLETRLDGLGTSVSGLETSLGGLGTSVGGLETALGGLGTSVSGLETSLGGLGTSVGGLETALGGLGSSVSGLESTVGGLGTSVSGLESTVGGLGTSVSGLESTVGGLGTSVSGLESTVGGLGTSVSGLETTVGGLGTSVSGLETTVGGLGTSVSGLETTVGGLGTSITGIQGSISGLENSIAETNSTTAEIQTAINNLEDPADYSTELANLAAGLMQAQTAINSITQELANVTTPADLATISSTLQQVQADVEELLQNSTINQAINITNSGQLAYVESLLGSSTINSTRNLIVNGTVNISITPTNFTTAEIARVNAITARLATILQDVTISNTNTGTTVNLTNLRFVDANYSVSGSDASDPNLATISGNLTIGHGGAADYSQASTIGGNVTIDPSVTSINLAGSSIAGNVSSNGALAGVIILPSALSVNVGTAQVNTASLTLAQNVVNLGYAGTIGSDVLIEAPAAGSIEFAAATVTGTLVITGDDDATIFNATNLTTASATTITVEEANFPDLIQFGGDSIINADTVTFPSLTANASGTLEFPDADSFVAPMLTITSNVTATDAITVEFLSGSEANLSAPDMENLTIHAQGNTTGFDTSGYANLETLNVTGATGASAPLISNVTNIINIAGGALESVTIGGGMIDSVVVTGTGNLTSLTTDDDAEIRIFTLNDADALVSASVGHQHIEGSDAAMFTVTGNASLASLTTTNLDEVGFMNISDNGDLASLDLSSFVTLPLLGTYVVTITNNDLTGMYTAATAGSTTTSAIPESLTSAAFASLEPYMQLAMNSNVVTYTLAVNLSNVAATGTTSLTQALVNDIVRTGTATNVLTDAYFVDLVDN